MTACTLKFSSELKLSDYDRKVYLVQYTILDNTISSYGTGTIPLPPKQTNKKQEKNKTKNKRPRGLDALLGHLLVKRIPVTYKLSSTKIPEYLSQK